MAEKPLEKPVHEEGLEQIIELAKEIVRQHREGRTMVFVDKELLEWLDKQVEAGKYDSLSNAIEVLIISEMQKK